MAIHDLKRLLDGQLSFEGGCDSGRSPTRIDRNQSALLVNATCRGDFIGQRPALIQCFLQFDTTVQDVQTHFEDGYFQGFKTFNHPGGNDPTLLFSISGRILEVSLFPTFNVLERALPDANPTNRPKAWFEQVETDMVWQDGQSVPLFISTGAVVRSDVQGLNGIIDGNPRKQVPIGQAMAYVNGRLVVALPDEISFVIGDIVGGPTGPLYFTENTFLNEGGAFKVPSNLGMIRSIRGIANLDTSLGQGPIQVLCTLGVFSCNAPADRTNWKDLTYPINTVSDMGPGCLSDTAASLVNSDIWYRARDGWRSFMVARRDFGMWSNTSQSHEVSAFIDEDSEQLLNMASSVNWSNWLVGTCQPQLDKLHGVYHLGAVALDFSPITSLITKEPPAWDGMWTGRKFMAFQTATVQGVERCFVACLSDAGKLELWEFVENEPFDIEDDGTQLRITRIKESPRFDFQNRIEAKLLDGNDDWFSEVNGTVDVNLFYRPDQVKCWIPWQHYQLCAKTQECAEDAVNGCVPDLSLNTQPRPRISCQRPPETCNPGTGSPSVFGYEFQTRHEITGACEFNANRLFAQSVQEDVFGACPPEVVLECPKSVCCGPNNVVESEPIPGTGSGGGGGGGDNPSDIGACCLGQNCLVTTRSLCAQQGGTFLGKGTTCEGNPCGVVPPQPPTPAWPIPEPLACSGEALWTPSQVTDPLTGTSAYVGINPGSLDPLTYLASYPGCVDAWSASVWSEFLASSTPYSQARLVWSFVNLTGKNFMGWQVYPSQSGGYIGVIDLNYIIAVEYCP